MNITPRTEHIDPAKLILPKDFKPDPINFSSLSFSIREEGLLHSPLVKDDFTVFAGKSRVKACQDLKLAAIECKVYPSNLDPQEYEILSLHENLKRFNLPWFEQVAKEKQLHTIRQAQEGIAKSGKKVGWSLRDTASELSMSFGVLSEDLRLADALEHDPELKRITDKATAKKVVFDAIKRNNQELMASQPVSIETNKCYCGDSGVILKSFPDNIFDACVTDPPWLEFKDASLRSDQFTLPVFKEVFRTLQSNAFLYMFVSTQDWSFYSVELPKIGFSVQKYPLIWVKEGTLSYGTRSWEHQRDYEPIMLAVKGSPALVDRMLSSIMSCKVVPSGLLRHPNEKPKEVIKRILNYCSYEGSIILDPFAGSFVVAETARDMRRRYVVIEKNQEFYSNGLKRLEENKK